MNKNLIGLVVAFSVTNAFAYSDAMMARSESLSVFDKVYEAGKAQSVTGPVTFQQTKEAPAAVIDLSLDNPVISVEETETERRYREVLAELEQNRIKLEAARVDAERKVEAAQAEVKAKADERVKVLEFQRRSIEGQFSAIKEQMAAIRAQEQKVHQALALNEAALADAAKLELEGSMEVARIKEESQQILMMAESSAVAIESAAKKRVVLERIDPTVVINERVSVEYQAATIEEIARGLMPEGWRVQVEFHSRPEIAERRYQFISTDPRDLALRNLTGSVRDANVRFAYFWDLTDSAGNPEPLLLITDRAK